jgi:23S rRNA (guanosine2251-2'-O)-methyltransferase
MKDLMKVMKRGNINFSYVPVEKLNRLTPTTTKVQLQQSPISFFDLETLIESV